MNGFHDIRFPTDISAGAVGGPAFSTDVARQESGSEWRHIRRHAARVVYNVSYGVRNDAQMQELIAFFRARKGMAYGFRFQDPNDHHATDAALGTGDGVQTAFELKKTYASGGATEERLIAKPVAGTVALYLNGVLQSSGFSVDHMTGVVTFAVPPANGVAVSADFSFDIPARFDTDALRMRTVAHGRTVWEDIPVVEIRID
jgi:uncharacterized protein (TIGR02217 family)